MFGEVDRARKLYEKFLEYQPYDSSTWIAYAELEEEIEEFERTQGILSWHCNRIN